jgi:adenine-specific DNA-methyltransferase
MNKISKDLNDTFDKKTKKENGIYFTPYEYRKIVFNYLCKYISFEKSLNILEPSFGSGEFIIDCSEKYKNSKITGVEINKDIFDKVKFNKNENICLYNENFINYTTNNKFDLIIGNPPYVVIKKNNIPEEYNSITYGRPNLFCLFIYKCIKLLKDDGILAFILPNSILNTSYYEKIRKYIYDTCNILELIEFNNKKFVETTQDTVCIILKKSFIKTNKYIINYKSKIFFNINYEYIQNKLNNNKNLKELDYGVKTGSITWNEEKKNLTDDNMNGTLLIYSSNIKNEKFNNDIKFSKNKKQYIISSKPKEIGPVILINRGYGNSSYNFNILFINDDRSFYAENHINIIYPTTEYAKNNISKLYNYLISEENKKYISLFTNNGALSKTELQFFLPISIFF